MKRRLKTLAQIAAEYLRETGNPAIGWGDSGLLHAVAERAGLPHESIFTEKKVLDRIGYSNRGELVKTYTSYPGFRGLAKCRRFYLPECWNTLCANP